MSVISIWAPKHGECGNTLNTMAISAFLALDTDNRVLVTQTQRVYSTLEHGFTKANEAKLKGLVQDRKGLDELERLVRSRRLTENSIINQAVILEKDRLDLLVGTEKSDESLFLGMRDVLPSIFRIAAQAYDAVLVDLHAGNNPISDVLLEESELVIISLPQNRTVLDRFFKKEYERFESKNHMLILGNYDPDSKYTINNIRRHYRVHQPIYAVPYCSDFRDAFNDADVLGWFRRNRNDSTYFFRQLKKVTSVLSTQIKELPSKKGA